MLGSQIFRDYHRDSTGALGLRWLRDRAAAIVLVVSFLFVLVNESKAERTIGIAGRSLPQISSSIFIVDGYEEEGSFLRGGYIFPIISEITGHPKDGECFGSTGNQESVEVFLLYYLLRVFWDRGIKRQYRCAETIAVNFGNSSSVIGYIQHVGIGFIAERKIYPRSLARYQRVSLAFEENQGVNSGTGADGSDSDECPSGPCYIPPRRFIWPVFRLLGGFLALVGGGWGAINAKNHQQKRRILGYVLVLIGWVLLAAPITWWL